MEEKGVWRTIRGRRVFIREGEDLASAMKRSGKFKDEKNTGKSTRAEVVEKIQNHIRDYYESDEDLVRDMDAAADPRYDFTSWQKGSRLVEGGSFLIANADMNDELNSWGINPKGKEYDSQKSYETYKSLMGREMGKIYDNYKKKEFHYAGEELYSDDPNRFGDKMRKYNEKMNPTKSETYSNPREIVNYYLKKGEFAKADQYMKEYGLEDERSEFIDGLKLSTAREYNKYLDDVYQSKVYGSDVKKADARMKEVFGKDFKYDKNPWDKEDSYASRKMEQYKAKKEQETYTKTGNIRYNAFGIERTPEGDFSDDGTRFTAYRLPNGMEMTVAKDNGDIYMSVRSPYNKEIKYEEYSKLPGYKELDMYNGVSKNSVDLNEVIKNSNTYKNAYNDLLKKKGLKPDIRTIKQIRIDSIKDRIDSNNINIEWYQNNNDYSRWRYNHSRINQLMKQNEKLRKELEKISK